MNTQFSAEYGITPIVVSGNPGGLIYTDGQNRVAGIYLCSNAGVADYGSANTYGSLAWAIKQFTYYPFNITCSGTFPVASTIGFYNTLQGKFSGRALFNWIGGSTLPMFEVANCGSCIFDSFYISAIGSYPLAEGIRIDSRNDSIVPGLQASHHNVFRDVWADGGNGYMNYGVRGAIQANGSNMGLDTNNDFMIFDHCRFTNYALQGASIEGIQAHGWSFRNCYSVGTQSATVSKCAVGGYNAGYSASNFSWDGGFTGAHISADFLLGSPSSYGLAYTISNLSSEGSRQFIATSGPNGSRTPISVNGIRWIAYNIQPSGVAMTLNTPGPIDIFDSMFGWDASPSPSNIYIVWNYLAGYSQPYLTLRNTVIGGSTNQTIANVFPNVFPTFVQGCNIQQTSTQYYVIGS